MKKVVLTLLIAVSFLAGKAQVYNSGGSITVASDAMLVIEGDYTSTVGGTISNDGIVNLKGHFINNGGSMDAGSIGTLNFIGTAAQHIKGSVSTTFYGTVNINNANGVALTQISESIAGILQFTSGKLTIGAFDLTLANNTPTAGADKYVVTDGTGMVKRTVGGTDADFPVGNSAFNPLILNNAGTADIYGVKVNDGTPAGWTAGLNHVVNRYWDITEDAAGESDLTVTPQWNLAEEQTGFDRTDAAVGLTTDDGATVAWMASGASLGTNPYTRSGAGFTGLGTFMVGDYFYEGLELDLKAYLAGPYDYSTNLMRQRLNTDGYLNNTNDPYGKGESVTVPPTDAVDWILVQFRNSTNPTIIDYEFAKFIDVNGNIIDNDGGYPAKFTGASKGSYYISISHRNHLDVMSANPINLSPGSATYNYSSSLSQVWSSPDVPDNMAMMQVMSSPDRFALWAGDANNNGNVKITGGANDKLVLVNLVGIDNLGETLLGYYQEDVNLDGRIRMTGSGNDKLVIVNTLGINSLGNTFRQHIPTYWP